MLDCIAIARVQSVGLCGLGLGALRGHLKMWRLTEGVP